MDAPTATLGVATESAELPPEWPVDASWVDVPAEVPIQLPAGSAPDRTRAAWSALAALLLLALGLLGYNFHTTLQRSARPTELESGSRQFAVDLNRADHAQLLQLPGVGENLATRIEAYRREHDGFRTVDELLHVSGIGPALMVKLRPLVYVEAADGDDEPDARPSASPPSDAGSGGKGMGGKKTVDPSAPIDVNTASVQELQRLPGIGPTLAARIVEVRGKAPFKTADDLRRVPGIGAKTMDKLRPLVCVENKP
jgi:competence protein ComEA